MVTFKFSPHTITKAKQYAGRSQGLSQGGGSSSQIIWPAGAPWCSAATANVRQGSVCLNAVVGSYYE